MDTNPDQRIVDRPEALDGFMRLGEKPGDAIARPPQSVQRGFELGGGPLDVAEGQFVRARAVVSRPIDGDLFRHDQGPRQTKGSFGDSAQLARHDTNARERLQSPRRATIE
jgi:hypothetical protein